MNCVKHSFAIDMNIKYEIVCIIFTQKCNFILSYEEAHSGRGIGINKIILS